MTAARTAELTNWGGNFAYRARQVLRPTSVDELRRLVAAHTGAGERLRALGTRHSFSRVADTEGDLVSLADLPPLVELDEAARTVTVGAGMRFGEFTGQVQAAGLALHNLGSLPHISLGGACATGTHGSGDTNGCLAAAATAVQLVTAAGDLLTLRRGDADFGGAVVSLGALGVVTAVTLELQPTYDVQQVVYDDLPLDVLDDRLDEVLGAAYSVSLFTRLTGTGFDQAWLKRRVRPGERWTPPAEWLGARLADGPRHPVPGEPTEQATVQGGVPGPWNERLPHFKLEFTPSRGEEIQSEYLVPREHGAAAVRAVVALRERLAPVLLVHEVRTVAADEQWASLAYRRDSVALHFTWVQDQPAVEPVVAELERALAPYAPRPHWGKLFTTTPAELAARWDRLGDLRRLAERLDPTGTFRNDFVERSLSAAH